MSEGGKWVRMEGEKGRKRLGRQRNHKGECRERGNVESEGMQREREGRENTPKLAV